MECDSWILSTVEGSSANFGKGFAQKSAYYLCYTSAINSVNPTGDVLYDVAIVTEKSLLPSGYTYVKEFLEPKISISKKKRLCVKLVPFGTADTAVFDILLSSKSKVVPNYMRIGEMSGFALWCRKEHVLKPRPLPKPRNLSLEMKQLLLESEKVDHSSETPIAPFGPKRQATIKRNESIYESSNVYGISAMDGVPFTLHPKFENSITKGTNACSLFKNFHIKSLADIEKEYDYGFVAERTAAARLPPSIS
ncbi:multivesicular body subunit 12A isoform X2 [Elgaria multicarinata webbii]|uniref:multivesicular body subunit 12A isoform X2 n=1 Tax=Elgaria multicarinata webbii TaxID=159646 RepID=UPI002FCD225E